MDYYEYNQNFGENKKDDDSDIEMKDLTELDKESIKFREKMWNKEINERKFEYKIKEDDYSNKNKIYIRIQ